VADTQPDLTGLVWMDGTWSNGDKWVNIAGRPGHFQWWRGNGSVTDVLLKPQPNPGLAQRSLCVGLDIVLGFNVVLNCSKPHASLCMMDIGACVLPMPFPPAACVCQTEAGPLRTTTKPGLGVAPQPKHW
jgi:hypothetical protein